MPQSVLLQARGLYTFPNQLSEVPQGALTTADNTVIDRNGIIEPRRGLQQYGTTFGLGTSVASQLMTYKKTLLMQYDSTINYDSDGNGTWLPFSGSYAQAQAGLRTKYIEANGNLYFTSSTGIQCISASSASQFTTAAHYIRPSGAAQALDLTGSVDYTTGGWFIYPSSQPGQSKVAYRMTWAFKDPNGNLVEGVPSSRIVLTNYSTTASATVNLTFQIPSQITPVDTQYFYTIYRTAVVQTSTGLSLADLDPGDEEYQVIQAFPSNAQLVAGSVTINDPTPESFRANGALLYTNPVSGEGINQANYPPPFALDINLYQGTLFFANTSTIEQLNLDMLSTENLISGTSWIEVNNDSAQRYTFVGSPKIQTFTLDTKANTTGGGYFFLNSASNERQYFAWFLKTGQTTFTFDTSANTTDGSYFLLNSPVSGTGYFVWFHKTTSTQPVFNDTQNRTPIKIDISTGSFTAAQVANLVFTNLPVTDFPETSILSNIVTVYNSTSGTTTSATSGSVPLGGAFAIAITNNTATPSAPDTVGKLAIPIDIRQSVTATDVANAFISSLIGNIDFFTTFIPSNQVQVTNSDNGTATSSTVGTVPPGGAFAIVVNQAGTGENTATKQVLLGNNQSPAVSIEETARSLVKVINANPASAIEAFYISGPSDLPGFMLFQSKNLADPAFTVIANSSLTGNEFSPALPLTGPSVISTNTSEPNAIYYSKFQQPEAVPIVNKFNVGPKDRAILRILPIRTGLMIFKEDGIYQLTGTNGQFVINPFDSSAILLAPDSAQVLNNQVYMFSTQGIVTVSDTGVSVISRPIENSLQQIITSSYNYIPNTFGVSYESDRAYLLWTVTNTNDVYPTQCFRYNTFTTAWTRWPITKNCGVVRLDQNIMYLGAADENFIEQERKNINRTDYADRQFDLQIPETPVVAVNEIILSSSSNVTDGDVLVQTQFLSIYQFNRLLKMLDADSGTIFKNYFSIFGQVAGADLRAALDNLAHYMDTDPGLAETNFYSSMGHGSNFIDFQNDYNILAGLLNTNTHLLFKNYPTSTGTVSFDMIIDQTVLNTNNVIVAYIAPIIVGPIILAKGINTEIIWTPQTFGDPSISKHVSEGTFIFDNDLFSTATISYASDLMASFQEVGFTEPGLGDWGAFVWNEQTWGGLGTNTPMRTYIPRDKQYCRFIRPRFVHNVAREKFSLVGTSLTFRPLTERAYRV